MGAIDQNKSDPKQKPPRKKRARIVLIDDHPMVRERLAELINRQHDFEVCGEAEDIRDGLKVIEKMRPNLAIVDLSLKDSFGLELVRLLPASCADVKVLVLTMHESALYAERAVRAGAMGYLTKREATTKIMEAIRAVLDGDIYISDGLARQVFAGLARRQPGPEATLAEELSDREMNVLRLIGQGYRTREITEALDIDGRTVETYRSRIKEKLNLKDGGELIRFAIAWMQSGESI